MEERRTTVALYESDLDWLKKRQLSIASRNGKWLHMADVVRALLDAVRAQLEAEEGA